MWTSNIHSSLQWVPRALNLWIQQTSKKSHLYWSCTASSLSLLTKQQWLFIQHSCCSGYYKESMPISCIAGCTLLHVNTSLPSVRHTSEHQQISVYPQRGCHQTLQNIKRWLYVFLRLHPPLASDAKQSNLWHCVELTAFPWRQNRNKRLWLSDKEQTSGSLTTGISI